MKKNEKKSKILSEDYVLKIEISDESSEMIMKLEQIIHQDSISHKLPTDLNKLGNKGNDED